MPAKVGKVVGVALFFIFGFAVFLAEFIEIEETDVVAGGVGFEFSEEFVFHENTVAASSRDEVFQLKEAFQVAADLGVAPCRFVAQLSAAKEGVSLLELLLGHLFADEAFDLFEEGSRLGWEFVEAATEDFGRDLVGGFDVFQGDGEHFDFAAVDLVFDRFALVLVEERDGVD